MKVGNRGLSFQQHVVMEVKNCRRLSEKLLPAGNIQSLFVSNILKVFPGLKGRVSWMIRGLAACFGLI